MVLTYRFKKERLAEGGYAFRPRILVLLQGPDFSIEVPALIDSGCDITVIPEALAKAIGIPYGKRKSTLYAYRESTTAFPSKATLSFLGKVERQSVTVQIPVLVAASEEGYEDEADITLGVQGIFDAFDITFKKALNRILLKSITAEKKGALR